LLCGYRYDPEPATPVAVEAKKIKEPIRAANYNPINLNKAECSQQAASDCRSIAPECLSWGSDDSFLPISSTDEFGSRNGLLHATNFYAILLD